MRYEAWRRDGLPARFGGLLLFLFPFLQASAHPTLWVGVGCLLLLALQVATRGWCAFVARTPKDALVLFFAFALVVGGFWGRGWWWEGMLLAVLLRSYFPLRDAFCAGDVRRRARWCGVCGASVCAAPGILQYWRGSAELRWVDLRLFSDIGGRATSFFENPNVLAIYLLIFFPWACLGACDAEERRARRVWCAVTALLCAGCLCVTWTRGAWLACLLQTFLFLLLFSRRTRKILLFSPLVLFVTVPLLPPAVRRRFLSIGSLTESSNRYRLHTWKGVCRMIAAHPFGIGVGERAFRRVYPAYAVMGTETVMHAHSVFLQIASELGIVGLLLLLALVIAALRENSLDGRLMLCGVFVMGMFDHLWYAPPMLFLVALALALGVQTEKKTSCDRKMYLFCTKSFERSCKNHTD